MKLKITRTLKVFLIVINVILIIGIAVCFYLYYTTPHFIKENIIKYKYTQKGDAVYQVYLVPNDLYKERNMEEEKIYITQLVDYIKVNFSYNFEGDKPADIKGDYEIVAVVEGYIGENDSTKIIWKKVFPIINKAQIEAHKEGISIDEAAIIKLNEYREYAKNIIDDLKVNTSAKLSVQMNVNLTAEVAEISAQESVSPTIEIPLNANYFTISKLNVAEKPGKVEETNQVVVPVNMRIIVLYGMIMGIFILSLLYLIIFTIDPTKKDIYMRNFNKIFSNHGNRLVALKSNVEAADLRCCKVRSIDDLVKIADELGKPVMYKYCKNLIDITRFYVFEDTWIYIFDIEDSIYSSIYNQAINEMVNEQEGESGEIQGDKISE